MRKQSRLMDLMKSINSSKELKPWYLRRKELLKESNKNKHRLLNNQKDRDNRDIKKEGNQSKRVKPCMLKRVNRQSINQNKSLKSK